ncbi:MAG TPA: MlaD family protein [Geobacteraceae bacterium]|nr:MlaD family protein [Geobacteraceae bacterium]
MKRSDNISWSQVKVGIFIICALIFLAVGIILMGKQVNLFTPKSKLSVIMKDVQGLKVGAPVWLAGIDVGMVSAIHFENPKFSNNVEIILEVDNDSMKKIGVDSIIRVKTRGLMGEKYVDITPSQTYSEYPVKRLYGSPTIGLDEVMQKAGASFDMVQDYAKKISKGEGTISRLIQDPKLYDNLVSVTKELSEFTLKINHGQGTLGKLYRSEEPYDRMTSILTRADNTLKDLQNSNGTMNRLIYDRELYDKLVSLADKSVRAADDVHQLNEKLTSPNSSIGKFITDREFYDKGIALMNRADNSIKALEEITAKVNRGEGTAGRLISDKELYDRMERVITDLDALVKDVKENPKRYVKFSLF